MYLSPAEIDEISELLAGAEESLPTEEQEEEASSVQSDTPLSVQYEAIDSDESDEELFEQIYKFDTVSTSIDMVNETLHKNYPNEDFDDDRYSKIELHRYISGEVTKFEFFLMENQWFHSELFAFPMNTQLRMRKGVHVRGDGVWHLGCVDSDSDAYKKAYFVKGILTVESRNTLELVKLMIDGPEFFFCACCEQFIFEDVQYYSDTQFAIPPIESFPKCDYIRMSIGNEDDYAEVKVEKVIAIIYPQKRKAEELEEYDSDDTLPAIDVQ